MVSFIITTVIQCTVNYYKIMKRAIKPKPNVIGSVSDPYPDPRIRFRDVGSGSGSGYGSGSDLKSNKFQFFSS